MSTPDELPPVRSDLAAAVRPRDTLGRSLLFAELAMLSYLGDDDLQTVLAAYDGETPDAELIDRDGAQAYLFVTETDRVVACRGTEPREWNDIKADANAIHDLAETVGRVHRGFKREVDDLWPCIDERLPDDGKDLWFTGHSLGGAMATICASRCTLSSSQISPVEVHTFGSPRVGTKRYVKSADVRHLRWVNNNDIVTKAPPALFGYRHTGTMRYLDADGRLRSLDDDARRRDQWEGFVRGLKKRSIDHFADHAIVAYVEHIARAVEEGPKARREGLIRRGFRTR
ncbi:MAG: lipase family protein [Actinomycetota bacterium]